MPGTWDGWKAWLHQLGQIDCLHGGLRFVTLSTLWLAFPKENIPRVARKICVAFSDLAFKVM